MNEIIQVRKMMPFTDLSIFTDPAWTISGDLSRKENCE